MPKDNNQTQSPQNNTAPVADDMPPIMMEDTHPPMINEGEQATVISDPVSPVTSHQSPAADSGSAAPADDIVMPTVVTSGPNAKGPAKKFGGGKIIATILGLFLLVGGVGAGVMLTQQNQDVREKASTQGCGQYGSPSTCNGSCGSPKADNKTYSCTWSSALGECKESGNPCNSNDGPPALGEDIIANCTNPPSGYVQCGSSTDCSFCLRPHLRTCNDLVPVMCPNLNAGGFGLCTAIDGPVNIYYCQGNPPPDTSLGCSDKDPLPAGVSWDSVNKRITGSFCGTVQVDQDYPSKWCSRTDTSGCGGNETNPPATTPPAISAVCQDVKVYSETWTLLTSAQLSQLNAGDKVNFCVTGSASSGSFNKARFSINGGLQQETTTVRPSGTDFCQDYTIPAGTTNFVVVAQINHITLGWK